MLVKDLEVGKIYECKLSGKKVLVIMTGDQKDAEGVVVSESVKAGKSVVFADSGEYKYVFSELHDGQLKE